MIMFHEVAVTEQSQNSVHIPQLFQLMELKSMKKTCLETRGMPSLTPSMSVVVTVTAQKKVLRSTNPVHWGVVRGEKCNAAVGVMAVGGQDYKHKAPLKNKCVAVIVFVFDDG